MPDRDPLTPLQLQVLRICWRLGKATGRQIYDESLEHGTWDYRTIATRLKVLEEKGYLRVSMKDGKSRYFEPTARRKTVLRQEIRRFLEEIVGSDEEAWRLLEEELTRRGP